MKPFILILSFLTILVTQSCIRDNEDPVAVAPFEGSLINPEIGGAAQPNQVWIDLSTGETTKTLRTKWDLGFYCGAEFKVILNSSILMAAGKIDNATPIDHVTETMVKDLMNKVQVANFDPANVAYIDDVKGNYNTGYTAIGDIKPVDSDNAIYLVNMGREIYQGSIPAGSTITGGDFRGWMKIQITQAGNGYDIKYADLNATTHKEFHIDKNENYNFVFFSLKDNATTSVQPEKSKWDLGFTVFVNTIDGAGSYIYSDFVIDNILGGVSAYMVTVPAGSDPIIAYNNFSLSDVDQSKLIRDDQRTIGSNWRSVGPSGYVMLGDRFFVVKDSEGLFYKIKFNRLTDDSGERGHPQFEYKPL